MSMPTAPNMIKITDVSAPHRPFCVATLVQIVPSCQRCVQLHGNINSFVLLPITFGDHWRTHHLLSFYTFTNLEKIDNIEPITVPTPKRHFFFQFVRHFLLIYGGREQTWVG